MKFFREVFIPHKNEPYGRKFNRIYFNLAKGNNPFDLLFTPTRSAKNAYAFGFAQPAVACWKAFLRGLCPQPPARE